MPLDAETEAELRDLALTEYRKICIGRPHMPPPDHPEGQRKIDRLFDIISRPFREAEAGSSSKPEEK